MVVIEEGLQWIGKRIEVVVTGALQTPTGRMVFSKASNDQPPNKFEKNKSISRLDLARLEFNKT